MMKSLLVILLAATAVSALTERERQKAHDALYNPEFFEGDILIRHGDRNAEPNVRMRWPNARVPYVLDPSLAHKAKVIEDAMADYHTRTCVRFVRRTTEKNYVRIYNDSRGCFNEGVGMLNLGYQDLSLTDNCLYNGIIIHELGHVIGFFHEQSRSDRDEYITIFWENIQTGMESQFNKLKPHEHILYNAFDYDSIMLYGSYAFSKDRPRLKTMVRKNGEKLLHPDDKKIMSESDVFRVNKMYNCGS